MIDIDAIKQEILSSDNSLMEAEKILCQVRTAIDEAVDEKYVKIGLISGVNISYKLKKRYGWYAVWHGYCGYAGENILYVPRDKCTKALLVELQEYDPYLGGDWKVREYPTID